MYRLMIADDQSIECRALEHKIQTEFENIEVLPSARDGIDFLKKAEEFKPDIAIVDINMPGLNGLETIEILKMRNINMKVIIHTSYSEFDYARKAIQLGAVEYLLKPASKEEMVAAIEKVCRILDKEKEFRIQLTEGRKREDGLAELAAGKWMMSLFLRQSDSESYQDFWEKYPQAAAGGVFTAWKPNGLEELKKVGWNWKEKEKLILEQMRRYCNCVGMRHKDIFYLYIFPGKALEEGYEEWIIEITDAVCRELGEEHLPFAVGISRWKSDPQQYDTGLYEARIAVQGKTKPGISFFQYGEIITRKMMLSDILPEVLQLLMENKTQECMELVRSQTIAEKNEISREETELFKVQALEFILQLRAEVENLAGENEIRWNSRIFTQDFGKMSCADEVLKWTETHIEELGNALIEKPYEESEYIRKVLHYIKGNFSKDLSLEDAGKEIGISSFYLSRLLKQERKTTFIETLTDIRLEAAVRMMKEGQLPMKEICCRSGYPNQSYFYRVVKKTTGMTVGVLRRYL